MNPFPSLLLLSAALVTVLAADQPTYTQDFENPESLQDFLFTDASLWKIGETNGNHFLELTGKNSDYKPPHRSPTGIALLNLFQVGDFVLEADVMQTTPEYGHRDACFFFGFQNPAQFYYSHVATKQDDHAHQVFRVAHAPRVKFTASSTKGVDWGDQAWKKIRIERKDGTVTVTFDGVEVQKGVDRAFDRGWLGVGSFDDTVRFDNLVITAPDRTDMRAPAGFDGFAPVAAFAAQPALDKGFTPLLNGKDLTGWTRVQGTAEYKVEGDAIVGVCNPKDKANTFLRTDKTYADFVLACEVKVEMPGNSGIQFRSQEPSGEQKTVFGYQCEIDHRPDRRWTGGIYEEGRRGWLYPLADAAKKTHPERAFAGQAYKFGEWNTLVIQAKGNRLQTWVNGVAVADVTDTAPEALASGFIGLQVHAGPQGTIRWKNPRIKEL